MPRFSLSPRGLAAALLLLGALFLPAPASATSYNFQKLSYNGARLEVWGINNTGTIVGQISTAQINGQFYGFIMRGDSFVKVPPYGSDIIVTVRSINDSGAGIVRGISIAGGQAVDTSYYYANNAYVSAYPKTASFVFMSDDGDTAGQVFNFDPAGEGTINFYNYQYPGGSATEFDGVTTHINGAVTAIGRYLDGTGTPQLLLAQFTGAQFVSATPLQRPGSFTNIQPRVINNAGDIAGSYTSQTTGEHGFIRTADGNYATVDVPFGTDTSINGMNDSGVLVGTYFDAQNVYQGFMATPIYQYAIGDVQNALLFASGMGNAQGLSSFGRLDADKDGVITARDAELILRRFTGLDPNS